MRAEACQPKIRSCLSERTDVSVARSNSHVPISPARAQGSSAARCACSACERPPREVDGQPGIAATKPPPIVTAGIIENGAPLR
jgi:hypothetical protein